MAALRALSARLASLAPAASGAERAAALGWAARGYTSPPRVPLVPEIMPSMEELLRGSGEDEDDAVRNVNAEVSILPRVVNKVRSPPPHTHFFFFSLASRTASLADANPNSLSHSLPLGPFFLDLVVRALVRPGQEEGGGG